ncbi:MAG: PSD1 domain-containing protein [Planctomycetes bacterium]|nr:PSD1 domain-containing protein [Planctomycetota bacterium]
MKRWILLASITCCYLTSAGVVRAQGRIQYARDILPILSTHCFTCHGPDAGQRKAGLRLDLADGATKKLKTGSIAVVPGKVKDSELIARIFAAEPTDRMPPKSTMKSLTESEKTLLKRWIEEGAAYEKHWAFVAPKRPVLPAVKGKAWVRNPVDRFLLARMEKEGLKPSPEADRYTLARRLAIDLTGLPPTISMVDRFVNDQGADAYEQYVDRLLAMPAFGERWAHVWLDLARYADSNGFATDSARTIWKYRDWVIDSINRNQPFDQFTMEQIAGDMLPGATQDQILATAFHRNTLTNDEGGTSDEEFRSAAVVDRVNTTMQVWMGITIACAQCHDHKYDPISQEEYFRMFAIFNQTEDSDKSDNRPTLVVIRASELKQKGELEATLARLEKTLLAPNRKVDEAQTKWEQDKKAISKAPAPVKKILALDATKRNATQKLEVAKYFRSILPEFKQIASQIAATRTAYDAVKGVPTPIMKELPAKQQRVTKIHIRGNFLDLGKQVKPGTPALFPSLARDQPPNRLGLAKWLVSPENPLTARVTVNRFWEQIFGLGLMETPDDFGIRGKAPTHPELLDWLSVEFSGSSPIALGEKPAFKAWDVKGLLRLLVTSAAYRQSSAVTPALLERDPENRLLARGPRFRSSAEVIRDQSLFVAGLLSPKRYGPPVRPPRPRLGLTAAFGGSTDWETSKGEDKYRRALYTQWRRTTPYPSMSTFDAPNRTVCTITRPRTNTPLQALVTLNDPVYVEAAQALGRRMVKEGGPTLEASLRFGFRLCLARPPRDIELKRLAQLYAKAHADFAKDPKLAQRMATEPIGPLPAGMQAPDMAAWTVVGNVLLNLDEVFAKR